MRALLLAAGLGTRLRPLTNTIPKCLVPIGGKPLLDYWLELLFCSGQIERVLINTHYFASKVEEHIVTSPWRNRIDTVFEEELLGTGGTVLANQEYFGAQPYVVAHADNLTEFDLPLFLAAHRNRPICAAMTMLGFRTDDPQSCGILELDAQNIVTGFHEKVERPPSNLANAAIYIFEQEVTRFIVALGRPVIDLSTEVIPHFIGRIYAVETKEYHRDIGSPESLAKADFYIAGKRV